MRGFAFLAHELLVDRPTCQLDAQPVGIEEVNGLNDVAVGHSEHLNACIHKPLLGGQQVVDRGGFRRFHRLHSQKPIHTTRVWAQPEEYQVMDIDDWRIALVVDPSLAPGFLANTVAVLAIGIGAACPRLAGDTLSDISGRSYRISANRPVPILQADNDAIRELFSEITASARERGGRAISIFCQKRPRLFGLCGAGTDARPFLRKN